jgi:hypothetical protein
MVTDHKEATFYFYFLLFHATPARACHGDPPSLQDELKPTCMCLLPGPGPHLPRLMLLGFSSQLEGPEWVTVLAPHGIEWI